MARSCKACSDLQENAADFVMNGVTEDVKAALMNNEGFNVSSDSDDCTDLNDANDCLIGNMEDEVDAYEVCDWKTFMVDFIHNLWSMLGAIIASICGIWQKLEHTACVTDALVNGTTFAVGEDSTDGSYVAAGKGVSFLGTGTEEGKAQIQLVYIGGGLVRVQGNIICYTEDFTDTGSCVNFDLGSSERTTQARKGNTYLDNTYHTTVDDINYRPAILMTNGGELLYEIRILKSQYPALKTLYAGFGLSTGGGEYHVNFIPFSEGSFAYGQHGSCDSNGAPAHEGDDRGHVVPEGYVYVQARMISITYLHGSTANDVHKYNPRGFMGIRLNQNGIECE